MNLRAGFTAAFAHAANHFLKANKNEKYWPNI